MREIGASSSCGVQERGVGGPRGPGEGVRTGVPALRRLRAAGRTVAMATPAGLRSTRAFKGGLVPCGSPSVAASGLFRPGEERGAAGRGWPVDEEVSLLVPSSPAPGLFPGGPSFHRSCFWRMKRNVSMRNVFSLQATGCVCLCVTEGREGSLEKKKNPYPAGLQEWKASVS